MVPGIDTAAGAGRVARNGAVACYVLQRASSLGADQDNSLQDLGEPHAVALAHAISEAQQCYEVDFEEAEERETVGQQLPTGPPSLDLSWIVEFVARVCIGRCRVAWRGLQQVTGHEEMPGPRIARRVEKSHSVASTGLGRTRAVAEPTGVDAVDVISGAGGVDTAGHEMLDGCAA